MVWSASATAEAIQAGIRQALEPGSMEVDSWD